MPPDISARSSSGVEDPDWDEFLLGTDRGQYQQCTAWAQYKLSEGWQTERVILERGGEIVGGFQMLWKVTRRGRIAYVSKGPVVPSEEPDVIARCIIELQMAGRRVAALAMIVQSPDGQETLTRSLTSHGFFVCEDLKVIGATLKTDVTSTWTDIRSRFRAWARNRMNKAEREGMTIVEGGFDDLPDFFGLMLETCERQKEPPNPSTIDAVRELWSAMAPRAQVRLTFAVMGGERVATQLAIRFGNRSSIFKVGWNGAHRSLSPNYLLVGEGMQWANAQGCSVADMVGFDKGMALTLLRGEKLRGSSRDSFKLAFGGHPELLPPPTLWLPNPILRHGCRLAFSLPGLKRLPGRLM